MNNNDDNNSPVITVTNSLLFKVPPSHLHRQHSDLILKYAILHLLLKLCTILGSLVFILITDSNIVSCQPPSCISQLTNQNNH